MLDYVVISYIMSASLVHVCNSVVNILKIAFFNMAVYTVLSNLNYVHSYVYACRRGNIEGISHSRNPCSLALLKGYRRRYSLQEPNYL